MQSPFTRSTSSQHLEKPHFSAIKWSDLCIRDTRVGHNGAARSSITLSNRSDNRPQQWVIRLGHKRSVRRLSLRGSIYQIRVRVPVDLRDMFGSSHVKRSLGTGSLSLVIRLARKAAFEIEAMFETTRREAGLKYDARLVVDQTPNATVSRTIARRSPCRMATSDFWTIPRSGSQSARCSHIIRRAESQFPVRVTA